MDSNSRAKKNAENRRKNTKTKAKTTSSNTVGRVNEGETSLSVDLPSFDGTSKNTTVNPSINSAINYSKDGGVNVTTPGFKPINLDDVFSAVHVPNIQKIEDVKNPNIEGKATESEHAKAIEEYKSGIRYQELIEWSNNYIGSQYKALASAVKAATKGLNAATELERLNQQFIELQKQKKVTQQKGFEYIEQAHKTAVIEQRVPYTAAEQIAILDKQKLKAEKAFHEAKSEEQKTRDFIANLGTGTTDRK